MTKIVFISIIISLISINTLSTKTMSITLDDLPFAYPLRLSEQEKVDFFHRILDILDQYDIKAAGFVLGEIVDPIGFQCLLEFRDRGHIICNHTYSHPDLNQTSCEDYFIDIMKCDKVINVLYSENKYFRYPMLHRGDTREKIDSVYQFLDEHDFIIASVSIDNDECAYNKNYLEALLISKDSTAADSIGEEYLKYMIEVSNYYDSIGLAVTEREIDHILLLHMNYINSIYLDKLFDLLIEDEWNFIPFTEAIQDPIYSLPDHYIGTKGVSYLERIQSDFSTDE